MADMSTPSERLWARRHEWGPPRVGPSQMGGAMSGRVESGHGDGGSERVRNPMSLARTAERVAAGLPLRDGAADFLDDLRWARDADDVGRRLAAEPRLVDAHTDAYLGALAEHCAAGHDVPAPGWSRGPKRFLDHFWWPSRTPGLRARAVVESPAAFRRRGIFIGRSTLQRV